MLTLAELALEFSQEDRPVGILIDGEQVTKQLIVATRLYASYAKLSSLTEDVSSFDEITADTLINTSEWGIIRPLFILYVERETAIQLEASRGMGVEGYGRSVSEIQAEITQLEGELPHKAFLQPVVSL